MPRRTRRFATTFLNSDLSNTIMRSSHSYRFAAAGLLAAAAFSGAASSAHAQTPGCNALELTRSPSYVRVGHNNALIPNRFTVEAWVQLAANFPNRGTILRKESAIAGRESWLLRIEGRRLNFSIRGSSGFVATISPSTARIPTGVPVHVAASWDGATTRLYIDGRRVASRSARVGTPIRTAGDLRIGQGNLQSVEQFLGRLDEVRIWNTVRTDAEISSFRARIVSGLPGQVASYSLDRSFRDSSQRFDGRFVGSGQSFQPLRGPGPRLTERRSGSTNKVFRLGDINGDGYEDFAVGQRDGLRGASRRGALRVFSGFDHLQLFAFEGERDGNLFGSDADGGDINGDGIPEVLVGEPGHNNRRGRIWVIDGRTRQRRVFAEGTANASFGLLVRAMPYLDADGRCDVITTEGDKVRGLRADGSVLWTRTPSSGKLVGALDKIGDINGDGYDDCIAGIPSHRSSQDNEGRAQIISGRTGGSLHTVNGGTRNRRFGFVVTGVQGDIDGDKIPDFLVATPFDNGGRGLLSVRSGKNRLKIYPLISGGSGDLLGLAASALRGDFTGDGVPDMLISRRNGSQGRVTIFDARNGSFRGFVVSSSNSPTFGSSIAGLNSNGDRRPDILLAQGGVKMQILDRCPVDRAPQQQIYGAVCAGTRGRNPRLAVVDKMRARVASSYTMRVASARPGSVAILQLGVGRANIALDAIGMRGCRSLVATSLLSIVSAVDANGYSDVTLPVPDDASLAGVRVNYQALCLDQGGNAIGLTATNGAEIVHGSK